MKKISLLCIATLTFCGAIAKTINKNSTQKTYTQQSEAITATITSKTTKEQLTELIDYFEDNNIQLNLPKVDYNKENEIVSIKILLEKGKQKSNYSLSSNQPILEIELGLKENNLFIKTKEPKNTLASTNSLENLMEEFGGSKTIDSILNANDFNFNNNDIQDFLNNSTFDLDALANQVLSQFNEVNSGSISTKPDTNAPKYSFINTPGINKLIIIDGKESDFETLNELAKTNLLHEVDNLKGATATSLYGNKAKDGAIIAITKK